MEGALSNDLQQKSGTLSSLISCLDPGNRYAYKLLDTSTYQISVVYLCGICNHPRPWLRTVEPYITVQDLARLVRCGISTADDAMRLLRIGVYAEADKQRKSDAPESVTAAVETAEKARQAVRIAEEASDDEVEEEEARERQQCASPSVAVAAVASESPTTSKRSPASVYKRLQEKMKKLDKHSTSSG